MVVPHARVVRDGQEREVDSRELVPGDVVLLESGVRVPADLRLTTVTSLQVDESLLTGESVPVTKQTAAVPPGAEVQDRRGVAYTGAVVSGGRGGGVVVATGLDTQLGAIAGMIRGERQVATPLQERMGRFARLIGIAVGLAASVAFVSGVALGGTVREMFLTAVALAVAAIPEGLPIAVTGDVNQAQTVALTTMVVFMAFHVGNARSQSRSLLRVSPLANPFLLVATVAALGVHIAALYLPPTQWLLRVEPIDPQAWLRIVAIAATVLVAVEMGKLLRRTRP